MEGMQEGGRESIWGLMGLHSFILNIFIEGCHSCHGTLSCRKAKANGSLPLQWGKSET